MLGARRVKELVQGIHTHLLLPLVWDLREQPVSSRPRHWSEMTTCILACSSFGHRPNVP